VEHRLAGLTRQRHHDIEPDSGFADPRHHAHQRHAQHLPGLEPNRGYCHQPSTIGSGLIATLDPATFPNGSYFVDLRATNSANVTQDNVLLIKIVGEYKPGRVTATITDLTVPAPGLPIQISGPMTAWCATLPATSATAGTSASTSRPRSAPPAT